LARAVADAAWVGEPPIRLTRYVRQSPEPPQHAFLYIDYVLEALYGGAAGGGKSSALLTAALQYVDVPGYSALLLRRSFRDLGQPDALVPRSKEWLSGTDAHWNDNDHRWTFPSGATVTFGYLAHEDDKLQYQGAAFQFVGFDELTQFTETQYRYLFSRLRRPKLTDAATAAERERIERLGEVPLRMRAASNPGGPGHDWVKLRFGLYREGEESGPAGSGPYICHDPEWVREHGRVFIPARLDDNPHLDQKEYEESLAELDPVTRAQLRAGDWDASQPGDLFRRGWFDLCERAPNGTKWVRFWDLAATEPSQANPDPDWTVGLKLGATPEGTWVIGDVRRFRKRPEGVETEIQQAAALDGVGVPIWIEQEPGSSGKNTIAHYQRTVLPGYQVRGERSTGSKTERAGPVSSKAEARLIEIVRAEWNLAFLDEVEAFPGGGHDDQVDGLSGAFSKLSNAPAPPSSAKSPWG
jgi:predicted phage terminase large subunit-like protein